MEYIDQQLTYVHHRWQLANEGVMCLLTFQGFINLLLGHQKEGLFNSAEQKKL